MNVDLTSIKQVWAYLGIKSAVLPDNQLANITDAKEQVATNAAVDQLLLPLSQEQSLVLC